MSKITSNTLIFLLIFFFKTSAQQLKVFDGTNSILPKTDITTVVVDKISTKWIGAGRYGLFKLSGNKIEDAAKTQPAIQGVKVLTLFADSKNNIWMSYYKQGPGLAKFDGSKWVFYDDIALLKNKSIYIVKENKLGVLYFGTNNGVICYDKKWWQLKLPYADFNKYEVLGLDLSNDGKIAIGTTGGLLLFNGDKWVSYNRTNGMQLETVKAVKFIGDSLYIGYGGSTGEGGFSVLTENKFRHVNNYTSNLPDQMIRDIEVTKNGTIWMATNDGCYLIFPNNKTEVKKFWPGRFQNVILDIAIDDKKKVVWVATTKGLLRLEAP